MPQCWIVLQFNKECGRPQAADVTCTIYNTLPQTAYMLFDTSSGNACTTGALSMLTDLRLCQATSCPPAIRSWPCAHACCLLTSAGMQLLSHAGVAAESCWLSSTHSATAALTVGVHGSWSTSSRCWTLSILAAGTWSHSCFTCMPLTAGSASAQSSTVCTLDSKASSLVLWVGAVCKLCNTSQPDWHIYEETPYHDTTVDADTCTCSCRAQSVSASKAQLGVVHAPGFTPRQLKGKGHTVCESWYIRCTQDT